MSGEKEEEIRLLCVVAVLEETFQKRGGGKKIHMWGILSL